MINIKELILAVSFCKMAAELRVILLGCGLVGRAVLRGIHQSAAIWKARMNINVVVPMVCESDAALVVQGGESLDCGAVEAFKAGGKRLKTYDGAGSKIITSSDIGAEIMKYTTPATVLLDCSATDATTAVLVDFLKQGGGGVVMANKKPMTSAFDAMSTLVAAEYTARVKYESTVGAGTPFVASVQRAVKAGDSISKIEGCFSGTLGFLTAGLQSGRLLSELVVEAHAKGYTEPDPRDDLSGMDVARKALILARTVGWKFEMSDVEIEALFPSHLAGLSVDEFKVALKECDAEYATRFQEAKAKDCTLRYVASVTESKLKVGLQSVPLTSPLGSLAGSDNIMQMLSANHGDTPLVVQGAGAGDVITAAGVLADMIDLAKFPDPQATKRRRDEM
eukprot:m.81955 g.81955  ORF g.81955 m.81955 type:complete len:394 (-) comp12842_c0_seq3:535-1716(-)